ncbi:PPE family protein [Mycobacterium sp. pUA109]|uniref:PPE family protein n=1 Tax=Mycobacterium sp. pUA109 TaxID=3238982 RepID=UPI00351AC58D
MDFGALPPEINSARMYSGPGSGPMLAAAATWDTLAAELHTTAAGYQSTISALTGGPWLGPAAASMLRAAAPYVGWLHTTAAQAEQAATQARAAASAYEAARAMTVPPPLIAANRNLLMSLAATNFLGQNTPAIAATEAHYGEMWAQDAAAMYGYAGASAAAARVTPFTPPPETTNPAGPGAQAGGAVSTGSRLMSTVTHTLRTLASPSSGSSALDPLGEQATALSGHLRTTTSALSFLTGAAALAWNINRGGAVGAVAAIPVTDAAAGTLGSAARGLGGAAGGGAVSAVLARAGSAGPLSVPQAWFAAAPATSPVAAALPAAGANIGPVVAPAGVPVMPLGGMAGRGTGRLADASRFLLRPSMVPRWPVGG